MTAADIEGLKLYYHRKYPVAPVMYAGRPLPQSKKRFDIDIRHFVNADDITIHRKLDKYDLVHNDLDQTALEIQRHVVKYMKYVSDETLGNPEYWLFPFETIERKKGDCEDGAILIASMILNAFPEEEHWRVRVAAGIVGTSPTAPDGGHAYVAYCRKSDNQWVILDWCYHEDSGVLMKDKIVARENSMYITTWFSFNHKFAYSHKMTLIEGRVKGVSCG